MGKGKKKGDKKDEKKEGPKKEELPAISSLSISEDTPSTSRETSAPPEGDDGLTGGGRKQKQKKAKPIGDAPTPVEKPKPVEEKPKSVEEQPKPKEEKPIPVEEKEEGGLGLDLGGAKKKRPRKKKDATAAAVSGPAAATGPTAASGPAAASRPTAVYGPPEHAPVQAGAPTPWGARASQTVQAVPPSGPPHFQPQPGYPGQPQLGYVQLPHGYPVSHPHSPPGFPQAQPAYPGQPQAQPAYPGPPQAQPAYPGPPQAEPVYPAPPQAQPAFARGLPQAPPGYEEPISSGQGRGRGASPWGKSASVQPPPTQLPPTQLPPTQPPPTQPPSTQPQRQLSQSQPKIRMQSDVPASRPQTSETTLCRFKIPQKIIGNTVRSRPVKVLTNYLPMTIKALKINRYDVSFKPDKPKKMIPKAFILAKEKLFKNHVVAFDQMKNCYALKPLPNVTQYDRLATNVEFLDNNGRTMSFEVTFKGTGVVDLGTILNYMSTGGSSLNPPTEAIQCIDVILRQGTLESYIKAGRQFFKRPSKPIQLGDGLEMWTGLFQSAIFTTQAFINIDVAHKGFPKQQPLIDALVNDFRLSLNEPIDRQRGRGVENFLTFLKGLRVMASIGGDSSSKGQRREFICNQLVDPPNKITFTMTDAAGQQTQMTVADYFAREKRVKLRYPNLNCVWVGPRDKNIYYPIELLEVSYGQALNKQLNEMQLSTMVREAATPPDVRKHKIEEVMRDMNYDKNAYFKQFGLDITNEFYPVEARVLQPPRLDVGDGQQVEPRKGAWQANKLLKAEALESWGFLALDLDYNSSNANHIITQMMNIGSRMGMRVTEPRQDQQFYNVRIQDLYNVLFRALQKEIKFLVIIVATRGRDYYHKVKKMAERDVGILTQCIKEYTATRRMNDMTIRNILLKVNSKLMGINQALDGRSMPKCLVGGGVMVVGADVTHPSPDQSSVPSIAAVTASLDTKCFIYNIQLSVQTPKKEMIVEFEDMMVEHLQTYKKYQKGALPRKIFVFRDGVSEGQFAQVMNSELQAVHNAYRRMAGPNAKPEVLFLLVQKRHHTRLFVPNSSQNVEPGTVVDKHIVHARELDFYLVSHQAIKGTARPTRYHAVCNDGGIPHDEVEQLTYYLCHLYSRCMRSVSYPTPTYYAHLACLRARSLTHGEKFNNAELERKPQRLRVMDKILELSRMFFV